MAAKPMGREFYSSIAEAYDRIFPFDEDLLPFLNLCFGPGKKRILDIGCSTGHLANALARDDNEVVGIDLDPEMIRLANRRFRNTRVSFQLGDMTFLDRIFPEKSFDGISCFGNTLVHLPDLPIIISTLKHMYQRLKPGGVLSGQIINYDRILAERPPGLPAIIRGDLKFERIYRYDQDDPRIVFETVLSGKAFPEPLKNRILLYPLIGADLARGLKDAGFSTCVFFADTDRTPLEADSYALYFVAEKTRRGRKGKKSAP